MADDSTVIAIQLSNRDWDPAVSGWQCAALAIPGAHVERLDVDGHGADTAKYKVSEELRVIRWVSEPIPDQSTAAIKLTKRLETVDVGKFWRIFGIRSHPSSFYLGDGIATVSRPNQ